MAIQIRPAQTSEEVAAAYEVAARTFGPSYDEARAHKARVLRDVEPVRRPSDVVVVVDRREVVGLVRLVERRLRVAGVVLDVAGMTSVAVAHSHRGRQLGVRLMDTCMELARAAGRDVAVLFARRAVDGWYGRFGFVGLGQHVTMTVQASDPPSRGQSEARVVLEAGCRPAALAAYASAYTHTYRKLPGVFVRRPSFWASLEARLAVRPTLRWLTATQGRSVVGYALVEGGRIVEAAAVSGAHVPLAAALRQRAAANGDASLTLALHPVHPVTRACMERNHTLATRVAWDGGHMLAVLNPRAKAALAATGLDIARPWASALGTVPLPVWSSLDEF